MAETKKQLEGYRRLIEISRDLASTLDLDTLLNHIIWAAKDLAEAEAASILLYDDAARQLYFQAATNLDEPMRRGDGYTLAQSGTTVMFQYTKPGISLWDYTWIANIYSAPFMIAVPANSPYKTLKEVVDFAKANPKKLRHGNTGTGSTTHLGSVAFASKFGCDFTQIAYKGEGPAVIGIASGEVDLSFGPMVAFKQMVEAGKLRILAICAQKRAKQYGQVPTAKEIGYDFSWDAWEAIFGPKGLQDHRPVYAKLSEAVKKTILDTELDQKMLAIGLDVQYKPTEELEKWLREDDKQIKKLTYDLGLEYK